MNKKTLMTKFFEKRYSLDNIDMIDLYIIIKQEKDTPMHAETVRSIFEFKSDLDKESALFKIIEVVLLNKINRNKIDSGHLAPLMLLIDSYIEIFENDMHFYKSMYVFYLDSNNEHKLPNKEGFDDLLNFCSTQMNY